jgi:2-polyprenyl-3-methyl-5-hydroxy-6-metoxy-1,4-benzoquinol methylase
MQNPQAAPGGPGGPTPERLMQLAFGFGPTQALTSALDFRLFTHVAEGKTTVPALEAATGASRRGLKMLLDVMVGLAFLTKKGVGDDARYGLTPESEAFMVEGRPGYHGAFVRMHGSLMASHWAKLTECVKTGQPVMAVEKPEEGTKIWGDLVDALFPVGYAAASHLGKELRRLHPQGPLRILDIAAGSGVWGIAAAQEDPRVRVTAFDLPDTLVHTRQWADRCGVADRIEFRAGDIRQGELGKPDFDAAILGHICHSEGVEHSRKLLAKVARALKPGGTIAIADMIPDDDRRGPAFPLMFALNMLVHTSEGDTFTFAEYRNWLEEASFRDARPLPGPSASPLILATRTG